MIFCAKSHDHLLVLVQVWLQRRPLVGDQLQEGSPAMLSGLMIQPAANYRYPLVIEHSHGKWPIEIDGLPIKNGDFPWLC